VRTASFSERLMPLGMTGLPMDSPQAYAAFLRDDFTKWRDVIERNNIGG
jgi:hypothetical protein